MVVIAGVGYWRISQGPLTLGFLSGPVENFINASLDGMRLQVKDVVIERDPDSNTIHLRLRRAQLVDRDGQMIARAPRAGIGLSATALFSGEIKPKKLEFIGPRILIKRTIDGEFQLGFGEAGANDTTNDLETSQSEPLVSGIDQSSDGFLDYMFQAFASRSGDGSAASDLESISISNAAVSIYDEANESFWYAPKTNLVFQRVPYGISMLAQGNMASGQTPWKLQLAGDYIAETGRFKLTAKVAHLVPAEMSELIFALSNLAKVQVPLSGEARFEFDRTGALLSANAAFAAGAGLVGFPGFITESLLVDEGTIRLNYVPDSGDIVIEDSSIHVGGSQASLKGRFSPLRNDNGSLVSWRYQLAATNLSLDTEGTRRNPLAVDRFEMRGMAAIEEGRLDIDDMQLHAGAARIQLRGTFIEGPEVPAVYLRGTMRNLPLPVLKKLWPPAAARGAREWIVENVSDQTIVDGDLAVNLTSEALAAALDDAPLPNEQLSLSFNLRNVTTKYFRDLPVITNATAQGLLRGNDFEVRLSDGTVNLPNGERLKVSNGRFFVDNLATRGTVGDITVDVSGTSSNVLRLIDMEPLGYAKAAGIAPEALGGTSVTRVHVRLPMLQTVTFEQVDIDARSKLSGVSLKSVFKGGNIEDGAMVLDVDKQGLVGKGTVSLNGVSTKLTWREKFDGGKGATRIEAVAVLDDQARNRLNIDTASFLRGPVRVKMVAAKGQSGFDRMHVDADLSKAEFRFDQLMWRRAAGDGAKATFDVDFGENGSTTISNLALSGPDHLSIKGGLSVGAKGELISIQMSEVNLGPGNRFALQGQKNGDGVLAFRINADSFDARPLVNSMFSRSNTARDDGGTSSSESSNTRVSVSAQIRTLFLHNHEHLTDAVVSANTFSGVLQQLRLSGKFANSKSFQIVISPDSAGGRPLVAASDDAGAALRAVDLYTRAHRGTLRLDAVLGKPETGEIKQGRLRLKNFIVRDEPALKELGSTTHNAGVTSNGTQQAPTDETKFNTLKLNFVVDATHMRIVDEAVVYGPAIGSTARGSIRRADGLLNIAGTLTPVYALNSAISNVPILGPVLMGGEGQGLFGVTFAVTGSLKRPRVTINPVSALAPGFLRRFLEIGGNGVQPEPAGAPRKQKRVPKLER